MIEDFGSKIDGAAKERWKTYRHRVGVVDDAQIQSHSLNEVFPEPAYRSLLREGVDAWTLAFVRAVRDVVPRKPTKPERVARWARNVRKIRRLCTDVLDGRIDQGELEDQLTRKEDGDRELSTRIAMYLALGHQASFRDFDIQAGYWSRFGGVSYDPKKFFCKIEGRKAGISVSDETVDGAVTKLGNALQGADLSGGRVKARFGVYSNRNTGKVFIGRKMGKDLIEVMQLPSVKQAHIFLRENPDEVLRRFEALRMSPEERRSTNDRRSGIDRRCGEDITPETFQDVFGFRGVQFGNYVEPARRQQDLNNAYDALMDMAEVVGCAPVDLSLKGSLGLAFGARGRGGKGAAAAHYEPDQVVINLTKTSGAGSLAHEWFHALDNNIGRRAGHPGYFATELPRQHVSRLTHEDREEIFAFNALMDELGKTGIRARSAQLDRYRSSPYYTQPLEVAARCFEAWIVNELERRDIRNDYLANISSEEVYAAEARLMGLKDNRYPYPIRSEISRVSLAFEGLFNPDSPLMRNLPGHMDAIWDTPVRPRDADLRVAGEADGEETGLECQAGQHADDQDIDFDDISF